jgi:zinc protease
MSVSPFRHASLVDLWLSAREEKSIDDCMSVANQHLTRLKKELVSVDELEKVKNRLELGFLGSLETVSGKGDQIGFCETVVGDPQHAFTRLAEYRRVTPSDVRRVASAVFDDRKKTVVRVVPRGRSQSV